MLDMAKVIVIKDGVMSLGAGLKVFTDPVTGKVRVFTDRDVSIEPLDQSFSVVFDEKDLPDKVGKFEDDGTIYVGHVRGYDKPLFTTRGDVGMLLDWNKAVAHAKSYQEYGHNDWRVPDTAELNILFLRHAQIGGFSESIEPNKDKWYWAADEYLQGYAKDQRFKDGLQSHTSKATLQSLRLVR